MQPNAQNTAKPLSTALRYFYGVGDAGFKLMTNIESFYFTFFLTNIAKFSTTLTGVVGTAINIVDTILSWTYGGIINSVKAQKWGRYRSWLRVMPWIVPFLFAFQFLNISANPTASAVVIIAAGILSHIVWNFPYTANAALVNVVGKTPEDKATLASSRAAWNNLGGILFSYLGLPFANLLAGAVGENNKFAAAVFVLGLLMAVTYYAHFKMTDGYEEIEVEGSEAAKRNKTSIKDMFVSLFQNPTLIVLIIADLAKWCMNFVVSASAIYYFRYTAANEGLQAVYLLTTGIAATIGAYLFRYMSKGLTSRTSMIFAYAAAAICLILVYVLYSNATIVIVLMTIAMFFYGAQFAAAPALYADTVVYATWKSGKDASGWIMGLQVLPLKAAILLRGTLVPAALAAAGYRPDLDPATMSEAARQGLTVSFALIPGIFLAVGALLLIFGFRLTKDKVLHYQAEIDARK